MMIEQLVPLIQLGTYFYPLYLVFLNIILKNTKYYKLFGSYVRLSNFAIIVLFLVNMVTYRYGLFYADYIVQFGVINIIIWISTYVFVLFYLTKFIDNADADILTMCFVLFVTFCWEIPIHIQSIFMIDPLRQFSGVYISNIFMERLLLTVMLSIPYAVLIVPFKFISKKYKEMVPGNYLVLGVFYLFYIGGYLFLDNGSHEIRYLTRIILALGSILIVFGMRRKLNESSTV